MSRRLLAIISSAILAIIAGILVFNYVNQADTRAISELSPKEVLVVTEQVPAGTPAEELSGYVSLEQRPASTITPEAIQTLDAVAGLITVSELYPGEQVLSTRFDSPNADRSPDVPADHHEITIELPAARVIGGHLAAGDTVGLFVSSEEETRLLLHKVLVTNVEGGAVLETTDDGADTAQPAAESVFVTLAVPAPDAPLVVNAAEFHGVWLSREPADAPDNSTTIDREDLFG
ncbi:Flp pilus assembly protein CpaB [Enteractinococcus coprophilus]|uniref:Pilus assembly protein CpaB n=1 Tax=Enteractinococcus coprophilus TaxID=1027633 RepID=A0A543AGD7_9MICC|nr:RcpC/CpaB family pilus assembly protein [Enteractinococcus coprophilus]TQL71651.1 pilus assembly protein CpaB [Enteractinococcus coprophilus]